MSLIFGNYKAIKHMIIKSEITRFQQHYYTTTTLVTMFLANTTSTIQLNIEQTISKQIHTRRIPVAAHLSDCNSPSKLKPMHHTNFLLIKYKYMAINDSPVLHDSLVINEMHC
jgi:hypothetical protein